MISRRTVWPITLAALASLAVATMVLLTAGSGEALWLPIVALAMTCGVIIAWSHIYEHDVLSPLALIAYLFTFLYVLRPIYILATGSFGSTRASEGQVVNRLALVAMTRSLWLVLLALLGSALIYVLIISSRGLASNNQRAERGMPLRFRSRQILIMTILGALLLALGTYAVLIQQSGGLTGYLNDIATRSKFFSDRSFLTLVNLPLKVIGFALLVAFARGWRTTESRSLLLIVFAGVIITDFLSGGRAAVLTGTILPSVIIARCIGFHLKRSTTIILVAVGIIFFVAARAGVRDYAFQSDTSQSRVQLILTSFGHLPQSVLGEDEAIPFDSLAIINGATGITAPTLYGKTYLPIFTYVIPRFLWPGKPLGGGNVWFTSTYYPAFFGPDHVETSISGLGELLVNFGPAGVVMGMGILLGLLALAYRHVRNRTSMRFAVQYAVAVSYMITFFRGDAFHSITNWVVTAVLVEVVWRFLLTPEQVEMDVAKGVSFSLLNRISPRTS